MPFTDPRYATNPACGDALAFWKAVYLAQVEMGVPPATASREADDAAQLYVERCEAFAANRVNPAGAVAATEISLPKDGKKKAAASCGDGDCG